MAIAERLSRIEALLEVNNDTTSRVMKTLEGPTGVVVRLDRVEQSHACLRKWTGLVGVTAVAALVQKTLPFLTKLFH